MAKNSSAAKLLRISGIVLMGLTAFFTVASGAGTACVALAAGKFGGSMAPLAPYQWLYRIFVVVTLGIGILAVWAVYLLVKGKPGSYRCAVTALILGIAVGTLHMLASRALRGQSMPTDIVVYTTVLTLILFLLLRLPRLRQGVDFEIPEKGGKTGGPAAAIVLAIGGLLTLTVQDWLAPTHTLGGVNYADAWHATLALLGGGLILAGLILVLISSLSLPGPRRTPRGPVWRRECPAIIARGDCSGHPPCLVIRPPGDFCVSMGKNLRAYKVSVTSAVGFQNGGSQGPQIGSFQPPKWDGTAN